MGQHWCLCSSFSPHSYLREMWRLTPLSLGNRSEYLVSWCHLSIYLAILEETFQFIVLDKHQLVEKTIKTKLLFTQQADKYFNIVTPPQW